MCYFDMSAFLLNRLSVMCVTSIGLFCQMLYNIWLSTRCRLSVLKRHLFYMSTFLIKIFFVVPAAIAFMSQPIHVGHLSFFCQNGKREVSCGLLPHRSKRFACFTVEQNFSLAQIPNISSPNRIPSKGDSIFARISIRNGLFSRYLRRMEFIMKVGN